MSVERCEFHDMPMDQCPHSVEEKALDGLVADGPTIVATQTSPCGGCGEKIEPGDTITHTEEGWAHSDEVAAKPTPRAERQQPNDVDWGDLA